MVAHDTQGILILDACRRAGVHVPDDVAVVSVDNDSVLCEVATPPLSSLDQNVQKLGFEAASLLARMMGGEKVANANYFIEPGQVIVRQSSDVVAVADAGVAKAIRFVRENACRGLNVTEVARAAGMSRRALEKKFAHLLGRSPLEEIQEIRFRRVRQLLLETDLLLPQIAELAGFEYQEYMVRFFKKRTGLSPGQYRRKRRFDT
jgi:LacI family transcriptional regulator